MSDKLFMDKAINLAKKGYGFVSPNPMVGAVIVSSSGVEVGKGFHGSYGAAHAEINAIDSVKDKAALVGSTLYVSLEPCNHVGKTDACTEAILKAGISKVVYASHDQMNGGAKFLEQNGINVIGGVQRSRADWLNRKFFKCIRDKRPYITLKIASTLDGKITNFNSGSKLISSDSARKYVHRMRAGYDAILVGANTVKADNPNLGLHGINARREPLRIIMTHDSSFVTNNKGFDVFRDDNYVLCSGFDDLWNICAERDISSVFVEGGGNIATQFLNHAFVDEFCLFISCSTGNTSDISWLQNDVFDCSSYSLVKTRKFGNTALLSMVKHCL